MPSFSRLMRAEWAKLISLRSTVWCLCIGTVLTVALSGWVVSSSKFYGDLPEPVDSFSFVHRQLAGDGSVAVRVGAQDSSHPWAKAGVIVKQSVASGSRYAALMLTPEHGVRLEAEFTTSIAGSAVASPRWLKLTRFGDSLTGHESADGVSWSPVGTVVLRGLPATVEVGLFVTSPLQLDYVQGGGAQGIGVTTTTGRAVFDHLTVEPVSPASWTYLKVAPVPEPGRPQQRPGPGGMSEVDGIFTVIGDGDIGWYGIPSYARPDTRDIVSDGMQGVQIGLLAVLVLGVLAAAGEYKTGTIRVTLTACPHRNRFLAAKALVLGCMVFAAALPASIVSFLIGQRILRDRGARPPAYPYRSLAEPEVLRAVLGTAAFLALLAMFALAVGMLLRRSSRAMPLVIGMVMVPQIVAPMLSLEADKWLTRLTPAAGLEVQKTVERFDTAISPLGGLGVLAAYTAMALTVALWALRRRDA